MTKLRNSLAKPEIPEWLAANIQLGRRIFGVEGDWHIAARVTDAPGGDGEENAGACKADAVYLNAELEFHRELSNNAAAKQTVIHEIGHVAHAQVDLIVERYILETVFDTQQREALQNMYRDAVEQFLQRLCRSVVEHVIQPETPGASPPA